MPRRPSGPHTRSCRAAWDASEWGIGGNCGEQQFAIPWYDYNENGNPDSELAPVSGAETWHINYKELYAGYTGLRKYGPELKYSAVVAVTDSSTVEGCLAKLWGPLFYPTSIWRQVAIRNDATLRFTQREWYRCDHAALLMLPFRLLVRTRPPPG
jgi:hypothetical protein